MLPDPHPLQQLDTRTTGACGTLWRRSNVVTEDLERMFSARARPGAGCGAAGRGDSRSGSSGGGGSGG